MKTSIYSASALALVLVAARSAAADASYATTEHLYQTDYFSDLGMAEGNNYQACSGNSVAVGVAATGSHIQNVALICGDIKRSNTDNTTHIDRSTVPHRGDAQQVMNNGRWLGGDNGAGNTCPDGQVMMGASCTGNDCTNMAIYCASADGVSTPHMTPDDGDVATYKDPTRCGWGPIIDTDNYGYCMPGKVLAGLMCFGERCSQIGIYCCPLIEEGTSMAASAARPAAAESTNARPDLAFAGVRPN